MPKRSEFILGLGLLIAVALLLSIFQAPSADDFHTDFVEVTSYRNENNTGPVQRFYLVTVSEENWEEMEAYGNLKPHSKYGVTTVYYFLASQPFPNKLSPSKPHFPPEYQPKCLARYRKLAQGQVRFEKENITW